MVFTFFDGIVDKLAIKDFRKPIAKQVFRNLLGRSYMTGREVATLTGVVRKISEQIEERDAEEE